MSQDRSYRTVAYLWNRLKDKLYQRLHPREPWLTPAAIKVLKATLTREMRGLEFGSGRSTAWFAGRLGHLTSVEHDRGWYEKVSARLKQNVNQQVTYLLREKDASVYPAAAGNFADGSLDFLLVDGVLRGQCALAGLPKLKPGGLLVVDDAHRYLPSESSAPLARKTAQGAADEYWQEFLLRTMDWEYLWTSNGVKDTVIFYKPLENGEDYAD